MALNWLCLLEKTTNCTDNDENIGQPCYGTFLSRTAAPMSGYPVGKKFDFGRLEKTFLPEVCHYGKNNQHCACTHVQFMLARWATCSIMLHTPLTLVHSSIARNSADSQIEVLVQHESCTCWTNKKRADWPQLSQTVHVLNRFCWTDWLKTLPIVSSRSTLHYITLHYSTLWSVCEIFSPYTYLFAAL